MSRVRASGYATVEYASSLSDFGMPRHLSESGGYVLEREIPGTTEHDAMGPYPLFRCERWEGLEADLTNLSNSCVALSMVVDPFAELSAERLREMFERVVAFKDHFVSDLSIPSSNFVSKHHRYYERRALRDVEVELVREPVRLLDEWVALYAILAERHAITGMRAFSKASFRTQFEVPGFTLFRAVSAGQTVGMHSWYISDDVAYSHLAAFNEAGYRSMAGYALYGFALKHFRERVRWLDLGASAGTADGSSKGDGLTFMKRGWASGTKTAYFCGRILQPEAYERLVAQRGCVGEKHFPKYRAGEFA